MFVDNNMPIDPLMSQEVHVERNSLSMKLYSWTMYVENNNKLIDKVMSQRITCAR